MTAGTGTTVPVKILRYGADGASDVICCAIPPSM